MLFQKAQGAEGLVLIKVQLFAAGLPHAAGGDLCKFGVGEGGPVPGEDLVQGKTAGALAGFQRAVQVGNGCPALFRPGLRRTAQQHPACIGRLGGQQIFRLRRQCFRQHGVHNGDHIADAVPAVQRVVPQHVKEFVHIKNAAGFHHHPVKAAHGHGDELGAHAPLVGVAVTPAADGLQIAPVAQQVLHQHGIHVHRAEVVFQNADVVPLLHQIPDVPAQKGRFAGPQKPGDQIHLYHFFQSTSRAVFRSTPVYRSARPNTRGKLAGCQIAFLTV